MIDYGENFNEPDYIKIDREEYQKEQEILEYYRPAVDMILDELYGVKSLTKDYNETINLIKDILNDLKKEI